MIAKAKSMFGYDAVAGGNKRRSIPTTSRSEDAILGLSDRRKLISTTRDARRNFAVAAWAIRKHLDYVARFSFQAKTGDDDLDNEIEGLIRWWSRPQNCDSRQMHSLRSMVRLIEAGRVVDGDIGVYRLRNGRLQIIESDRIKSDNLRGFPKNAASDDWVHGVKLSPSGAPTQFMIADRNKAGQGFEFKAIVPAKHFHLPGYRDRYDQIRGISPLASAINSMQDVYEGTDYALGKMKLAQLFGLAIFSDTDESAAEVEHDGTTASDGSTLSASGYSQKIGGGPKVFEYGTEDRVEFLETKTPATETKAFMAMMLQMSIKALDIPYALYDESVTNFAGLNAAIRQYKRSCKDKQDDLIELLDSLTHWRLSLMVDDGLLTLPQGMTVSQLRWDWVPDGVPWWDRSKEVVGDIRAIAAGLDNPQRVCRETGTDFKENIDRIAEARQYAKEMGVTVDFTVSQSELMEAAKQDE